MLLRFRGNPLSVWPPSFSVAPTAPPVGSYDVGGQDSNAGAASFHKAARFKSNGSGTKSETHTHIDYHCHLLLMKSVLNKYVLLSISQTVVMRLLQTIPCSFQPHR